MLLFHRCRHMIKHPNWLTINTVKLIGIALFWFYSKPLKVLVHFTCMHGTNFCLFMYCQVHVYFLYGHRREKTCLRGLWTTKAKTTAPLLCLFAYWLTSAIGSWWAIVVIECPSSVVNNCFKEQRNCVSGPLLCRIRPWSDSSYKSCLIWVCSVCKSVKRCLHEVKG